MELRASRFPPRAVFVLTAIALIQLPTLAARCHAEGQAQQSGRPPRRAPFHLQEGDRLVLLGDASIERMQQYGYLETLLASRLPHLRLSVRNLGWSGDTVRGVARAVFGKAEDGFKRLIKDVTEAKPTVILVCYGGNEAHEGESGLESFRSGLNRLLDELEKTGASIVLVSPTPYDDLSPRLKSAASYNAKLTLYCDELRRAARRREYPYLDMVAGYEPGAKDNGVHFSQYGYWREAFRLADKLGAAPRAWRLEVEFASRAFAATNTQLTSISTRPDGLELRLIDRYLPDPAKPKSAPRGSSIQTGAGVMRVTGLPAGRYELRIDGESIVKADAAEWSQGLRLPGRSIGRTGAVRRAIVAKNEFYFHRHRPQNETYLFLFRKHEQGNNAVEIPQFDPLVAKTEQRIQQLTIRPKESVYSLRKLNR